MQTPLDEEWTVVKVSKKPHKKLAEPHRAGNSGNSSGMPPGPGPPCSSLATSSSPLKSSKAAKAASLATHTQITIGHSVFSDVDANDAASVMCLLDKTKASVSRTPYYAAVRTQTTAVIASHWLKTNDISQESTQHCRQALTTIDVVALGIGHFSSSATALYQMSLLLLLVDDLADLHLQVRVDVFDPIMTRTEQAVCASIVPGNNSNSKAAVTTDADTADRHSTGTNLFGRYTVGNDNNSFNPLVLYMPHCPYQLYNNALWANWDCLDKVMIIGNSMSKYELTRAMVSFNGDPKADCICVLRALVEERQLVFNRRQHTSIHDIDTNTMESAFNDLSLHTFEEDTLASPEAQVILRTQRATSEAIEDATRNDSELFI